VRWANLFHSTYAGSGSVNSSCGDASYGSNGSRYDRACAGAFGPRAAIGTLTVRPRHSSDGSRDLYALGGFLRLAPIAVALLQIMSACHRRRAFASIRDNLGRESRTGLSGNSPSGCVLISIMTTRMIRRTADDLVRRRLALGHPRELLRAAAGGISSATVKRIERSVVSPLPATLTTLGQALGCEVS